MFGNVFQTMMIYVVVVSISKPFYIVSPWIQCTWLNKLGDAKVQNHEGCNGHLKEGKEQLSNRIGFCTANTRSTTQSLQWALLWKFHIMSRSIMYSRSWAISNANLLMMRTHLWTENVSELNEWRRIESHYQKCSMQKTSIANVKRIFGLYVLAKSGTKCLDRKATQCSKRKRKIEPSLCIYHRRIYPQYPLHVLLLDDE